MPIVAHVSETGPKSRNKFKAVVYHRTKSGRLEQLGTVRFGLKDAEDFTLTGDEAQRYRYLVRHGGVFPKKYEGDHKYLPTKSTREDWSRKGYLTAGWWSRHLLWAERTKKQAAETLRHKWMINVEFV